MSRLGEQNIGLVLSGGGMRGAYEAGVLAGLVEALGASAADPPAFRVFAGASIGALNSVFLAANADRGDHGAWDLARSWGDVPMNGFLRLQPRGLLQGPLQTPARSPYGDELRGVSLFDPGELERLVHGIIDWQRLHDNVKRGLVRAAVVAALQVRTGATAMFAEVAPGVTFRPSRDERRVGFTTTLAPTHVLASAALPFLFPARCIEGDAYVDGGLRFSTPIAPALRLGAERLVVISALYQPGPQRQHRRDTTPLTSSFFVGKLLAALLLDSIGYDIAVLERLNRMLGVLEQALSEEELQRVQRVFIETRGLPYKRVQTLVFTPSEDLGMVAARIVKSRPRGQDDGLLKRGFARWLSRSRDEELEWTSYVFFDREVVQRFIELGRADALRRRDDIRRFFGA